MGFQWEIPVNITNPHLQGSRNMPTKKNATQQNPEGSNSRLPFAENEYLLFSLVGFQKTFSLLGDIVFFQGP